MMTKYTILEIRNLRERFPHLSPVQAGQIVELFGNKSPTDQQLVNIAKKLGFK